MSKMGLNAVSQHDNYWLYCTADLFTLKMSFHCSLLNDKVDEQSSLIFSIYLDVYDTKSIRQLLYQLLIPSQIRTFTAKQYTQGARPNMHHNRYALVNVVVLYLTGMPCNRSWFIRC